MTSQENMRWAAEHLHWFAFHSPEAAEWKQSLQSWWALRNCPAPEARKLQARFLLLCGSDPFSGACGWFSLLAERKDARRIGKQLGLAPGIRDISPLRPEACFLRSENCFLGMLPPETRPEALSGLMDLYYTELDNALGTALEHTEARRNALRTRYTALYEKTNQFTLFRGLAHSITLGICLYLLPLWAFCLRNLLSVLIQENGDWYSAFGQTAIQTGLISPQLFTLLLLIPLVFWDWKQFLWESWFSLYRAAARITLRFRYHRTMRSLRQIRRQAKRHRNRFSRRRKFPHPLSRGRFCALDFRMPGWVKTGWNPGFVPKKNTHWLRDSFLRYPTDPLPGRAARTAPLDWTLLRLVAAMLLLWLLRG